MTQEKAIAAFANEEKAFSRRMILVADEIQNIERIRETKMKDPRYCLIHLWSLDIKKMLNK